MVSDWSQRSKHSLRPGRGYCATIPSTAYSVQLKDAFDPSLLLVAASRGCLYDTPLPNIDKAAYAPLPSCGLVLNGDTKKRP